MPRAWACTTVVAMNTTTTHTSVLAATLRGEGSEKCCQPASLLSMPPTV